MVTRVGGQDKNLLESRECLHASKAGDALTYNSCIFPVRQYILNWLIAKQEKLCQTRVKNMAMNFQREI